MPRISALGLDVGKKRIGVAGCDGTGLIATGLTTIERRSFVQVQAELQQIVQERQGQVLVVGLPYSMDGSLGFQARQVQKFAKAIAKALQLPMEYMDERLTSFQAEQLMQSQGISVRHHKGLVDRKAAALILQQWLDDRRQKPLLAASLMEPEPSLPEQSSADGAGEPAGSDGL